MLEMSSTAQSDHSSEITILNEESMEEYNSSLLLPVPRHPFLLKVMYCVRVHYCVDIWMYFLLTGSGSH